MRMPHMVQACMPAPVCVFLHIHLISLFSWYTQQAKRSQTHSAVHLWKRAWTPHA